MKIVAFGLNFHYDDVIMGAMASQITSLTIVYSTVYSDADQRKHQSSASLAFVRGNHRGPVNSPHKWQVSRKMSPFEDVIMSLRFVPNGPIANMALLVLIMVWSGKGDKPLSEPKMAEFTGEFECHLVPESWISFYLLCEKQGLYSVYIS